MSTEQEHELVPMIRDWLAATSDVDIPPGLSREEARQRASKFLAEIAAGNIAPDHVDVDDNLKDVLWAAVEKLEREPFGRTAFEACDRFYQFVSALSVKRDPLHEIDEVLHRVSRAGWRSAPGGLEAILKTRASVLEYGDDPHHRGICESADELRVRIGALRDKGVSGIEELLEICTNLCKLSTIRVDLVFSSGAVLVSELESPRVGFGSLDDREYLKAVATLVVAVAARLQGEWGAAEIMIEKARSAFRRTANHADLERVEVEGLALVFARGDFDAVCEFAPALIERLAVPKEQFKSRLILAWTLLDLRRPQEAREILEAALSCKATEDEPAIRACALTVLGMTFTDLGLITQALASFRSARVILSKSRQPLQEATLTSALGELLGRQGNLAEAAILYATARETYRELGQWHMFGYLSVLIAELFLLLGRSDSAEAELRAALPLIEKFDLRREGAAAVALLGEAVANKKRDLKTIQVLRDQLRKGT